MKLRSDMALISIRTGRAALAKHIEAGGQDIPITIQGTIVSVWGRDDGIDQEFQVKVTHLSLGTFKPAPRQSRRIDKKVTAPRTKVVRRAK